MNQVPELDDVTSSLDALATALSEEDNLQALLQQVCRQVTHAIPGADHASLTLLTEQGPHTIASTGYDASGLDLVQYEARRGPCLHAADSTAIVRLSLDDAWGRWPEFAKAASAAGVGSFLSAPLQIQGENAAAINCYSWQGHGFAEVDDKLLDLFISAVQAALHAYRRYQRAAVLAAQLRSALESRAVIDQAKGIVMAARGVDADHAFKLLVEQSQRENVKVRDLAKQYVDLVLRKP